MDIPGPSFVSEFNAETVDRGFVQSFEIGKLFDSLRQHWSTYVPEVYNVAVQQSENAQEERRAKKLLFKPMERFLCGADPTAVFEELAKSDNPPQICGHVFKLGEPTYSCRNCGMDPTCVLCITCFQNSPHQSHRYKMSTSSGGGYCDCGDVEAWKADPFCDIHKQGVEKQKHQDPVANLPDDLRGRAEALFHHVVTYAVDILTWPHTDTLPEGLKPMVNDNTYATVLFNDEVHTYEQVITTLIRAVDCTQKEAVDFATAVDRDGRTIVKAGPFVNCEKARGLIEQRTLRHHGKPLKVLVMLKSVVAHQIFAQKILSWLQDIISKSDGLRQLFSLLSMRPVEGEQYSLLERMMLADTQLWKCVRTLSHQLFMMGVLKDLECKRQFSILFTKNYARLMAEYIKDDHDHSVCVVSESVQIYTVPTVARMLISEHNLLEVILRTFLEECHSKLNHGKLTFERNDRAPNFRRASFMLYDLKYALTCKPSPGEWTDALRQTFMNGFRAMLDLLKCMQCMGEVTRQTGQHIEFEPEWESAFNLQLKLEDNIAVMLEWCATDKQVLVDAFNATVDKLLECRDRLNSFVFESCTVNGISALCIKYDVASQPVSIHVPLTRMLAGLYPLLNNFDLSIKDIHKKGKVSMSELMEPSLRVQVLVAQTQANMWRRNGFSLLNQIYFYHNVRCRSEMFDKDVVMLQAAAALIPANDFLIQVLNKFNLLSWARLDYDTKALDPQGDTLRQTITLVEEFLMIVIYIIAERYYVGVGNVTNKDKVRREIIHHLCLQPMAHSELIKYLPEDHNHETGVEDVVHEIADFTKVSGSGKGTYVLKDEYYKEFSPMFYHFTRGDQSKSEEVQRKRKMACEEDLAMPPPVQPEFTRIFAPVSHLLDCEVMLYIMKTVLLRSLAPRSRSLSEMQLEKVLYLIGLALHEEQRAHHNGDSSFKFIEKACAEKQSIYDMLIKIPGHYNFSNDSQKGLLNWVIQKFNEVRQLRDSSFTLDASAGTSTSAIDEKSAKEKKKRAEKAAKRRNRIMNQMSKLQRNFIQDNAELFENTSTDIPSGRESGMEVTLNQKDDEFPVCLGQSRALSNLPGSVRQTCILCQEEQDISHQGRAMVLACYIQKSTVLSKKRIANPSDPELAEVLFMDSHLNDGVHTSTCGHVMHSDCWKTFFEAIVAKEQRRHIRLRNTAYDVAKSEFLCPLCETLSNTVIPIIPHLSNLISPHKIVNLSLNEWLDGMQKIVNASIQNVKTKPTDGAAEGSSFYTSPPLSDLAELMTSAVYSKFQALCRCVFQEASTRFSDNITDMLGKFINDVYAFGLNVSPNPDDPRVPLMAWRTCAYTILVIENSLREPRTPLFGSMPSRQIDAVAALVKFAAVCNQVIDHSVIKKHSIALLSALLGQDEKHQVQNVCLLDFDCFHYLVELVCSLPVLYAENEEHQDVEMKEELFGWESPGSSSPQTSKSQLEKPLSSIKNRLPKMSMNNFARIPSGGLNEQHALYLTFTAHLVQILLTADLSSSDAMEVDGDDQNPELVDVYIKYRSYAGMTSGQVTSWHIVNHLQTTSLPFLRSTALFFHHLTGVRPPDLLFGECTDTAVEFETLCTYLALPTKVSSLLVIDKDTVMFSLIQSWCQNPGVHKVLHGQGELPLVTFKPQVNHLVRLPEDYSHVINQVSTFTCPNSDGDDSRAPTMCLVCGMMLCSQSYCCQTELEDATVGAATAHAHTCGAGTGIFLRVRDCQVLFLCGRTKGCFHPPPYLDDYGETDQGLRRGNPLHLCHERYEKLHKIWLNHSIPECIARCLEANNSLLSIDWLHL